MVVGMSLALLACSPPHDGELKAVGAEDCAFCHNTEYQETTTPPHIDLLPDECVLCHDSEAWVPAQLDHASVKDRLCSLCHLPDYANTQEPIHMGLYPTTCVDCHGTQAWRPALNGVHPEADFPLADGPHKKIGCTDCHDVDRGTSTDGVNADCIGCHSGDHARGKVDDQHDGVADYVFDETAPNFCLLCHPNGQR